MDRFFLPVMSHFLNGNPWSASSGRLRYRVLPDTEEKTLTAQVWEGPWAFEFSQVEEEKVFPLSEEGLADLGPWLAGWKDTVSARPVRSLAADLARRQEPKG